MSVADLDAMSESEGAELVAEATMLEARVCGHGRIGNHARQPRW